MKILLNTPSQHSNLRSHVSGKETFDSFLG